MGFTAASGSRASRFVLDNWIKLKNCEEKNVNKKKIKNRISVLPKGVETAKQDAKYMIIILQCSPSSVSFKQSWTHTADLAKVDSLPEKF